MSDIQGPKPSTGTTSPRSKTSRGWPPIVAALLGAILVFLVLPNPLSVPQTNPSASAEYAPVPGKQEEAQSANFSQTNTASSSGIGAGGEGIGALPGFKPPPLPEFQPRQKDCVGNPPKQTEDPLSPPCVPFFDGKNGGSTYPGVTKDDIIVIFYNDRCCDGELSGPWKPSQEPGPNCGAVGGTWECDFIVRTVKAHHRYFQRRYQTYGRTVRLMALESTGNLDSTCAERQQDAKTAIDTYKPFATVSLVGGNQHCYDREFAKRRIPVFGLGEDSPEDIYEELRPYSFGFLPSQEVQTSWSAGFICNKLRNQTADFTDDPALRGNRRRFGFIRPDGESRGSELPDQAALLAKELKAQCNFEFDIERKYLADTTDGTAGAREANGIMTTFKRERITTIVCYCFPVRPELTVSAMQSAAEVNDYAPEWFFDQASAMDRGIWLRENGSKTMAQFGTTYFWRTPAFREQYHFQAYLQEEPGTEPNIFYNYRIYHLFLNLYQAIQASGPNLTPDTVEQGMFTFNFLDRGNPWVPTGGYGPYGRDAISSYTFVDTGMGWWWDPEATPPGGQPGEGCVRVIRQGVRFYPDAWPKGDSDMFLEDDPCSQDLYKIRDPSSAGRV